MDKKQNGGGSVMISDDTIDLSSLDLDPYDEDN
jgi:hypothetical protein